MLDNLGFFKPYYDAIDATRRASAYQLIKERRLIISNSGSVSSHDLATNYYLDMISNIQTGANWLESNFRVSEIESFSSGTSAWAVDQFGHSLTGMYLMKKAGANSYVAGRIDDSERFLRRIEKSTLFD